MARYQCCSKCQGAVKMGGGALCRRCRRDAVRETLQIGSIGRLIAERRLQQLMSTKVVPTATTSSEVNHG